MPLRPKRSCPDCRRLTRTYPCDQCGGPKSRPRVKPRSIANRIRATNRWRRTSEIGRREHPFCQNPFKLKGHELVLAVDRHHIIPIEERPDLAFDEDNLLNVCRGCHSKLEGMTNKRGAKVITIVCGPPASGKSTYVRARAKPGDLVVDVDSILSCISGLPEREGYAQFMTFATAARDAIIERLKAPGLLQAAWIIGTYQRPVEREVLVEKLGAKVVVMDTLADKCKERIKADPSRRHMAANQCAAVDSWFELNHG